MGAGRGWQGLAGAGWAIPMTWQRCGALPWPPGSAVRGDSPLVPRKVVILGPSILELCLDPLPSAAEAQTPCQACERREVRPRVLKTQG